MALRKTKLTLALGSALAASLSMPAANANDNPFAAQALSKGYMLADAETDKAKEMKCGACGNNMKKADDGKPAKSTGTASKKKRHRDCDKMKTMMKDEQPVDIDKAKEMKCANCGNNMKKADDKSKASEGKCANMK